MTDMDKIELPYLCERFVGVTIPENDCFYACDHDEVLKVDLKTEPPSVSKYRRDPYDFVEERRDFIGLVFEGLEKNPEVHKLNGYSLTHDHEEGKLKVNIELDLQGMKRSLVFDTFAEYWFCASFSKDGRYLILAEPNEVEVYRL